MLSSQPNKLVDQNLSVPGRKKPSWWGCSKGAGLHRDSRDHKNSPWHCKTRYFSPTHHDMLQIDHWEKVITLGSVNFFIKYNKSNEFSYCYCFSPIDPVLATYFLCVMIIVCQILYQNTRLLSKYLHSSAEMSGLYGGKAAKFFHTDKLLSLLFLAHTASLVKLQKEEIMTEMW